MTYPISNYETYKENVTTFTVASAADMVKLADISKSDSLEGKTIITYRRV